MRDCRPILPRLYFVTDQRTPIEAKHPTMGDVNQLQQLYRSERALTRLRQFQKHICNRDAVMHCRGPFRGPFATRLRRQRRSCQATIQHCGVGIITPSTVKVSNFQSDVPVCCIRHFGSPQSNRSPLSPLVVCLLSLPHLRSFRSAIQPNALNAQAALSKPALPQTSRSRETRKRRRQGFTATALHRT